MGRVASAVDNSMMESFFGTLQLELLDRRSWTTRAELASAIFEWIEGWYNPRRRHTSTGDLSPVDYERRPRRRRGSGMMSTRELSGEPGLMDLPTQPQGPPAECDSLSALYSRYRGRGFHGLQTDRAVLALVHDALHSDESRPVTTDTIRRSATHAP